MDGRKDGWMDGGHELIYECWLWELMGGEMDGWMTCFVSFVATSIEVVGHENEHVCDNKQTMEQHSSSI